MNEMESKIQRFIQIGEVVKDGLFEMHKIQKSFTKEDEKQFLTLLKKNPIYIAMGKEIEKELD